MPGASLRKSTSAVASDLLHENPQQILLRRALSSRRMRFHVTNVDGNYLGLRSLESTQVLSNSTNNLKEQTDSVKMRKPRDKALPRPISLDLSHVNQIFKSEEECTACSPEQIPDLVLPKRSHLTLFDPEAANRGGSLRFSKGRRRKALRRRLVRSATIVGETIRAPIGDYLKESWDAFLTKITERQSELRRQAAEACDWLIAAGFPQYSHIYKAGDFPLNLVSAASDHLFLEEEEIGAMLRRLNILNKCANLKLDRTLSREVLADQEEEEYERYALSELWFLEENGRRWARTEETNSSLDSPAWDTASREIKTTIGRLASEETTSNNSGDNNNTVRKIRHHHCPQSHDINIPSGEESPTAEKPPKVKGSSFLKRFGGDLKKLSSFKKRDFLRSNSADKAQEQSPRSDKLHFSSGRGYKRNHKVIIGEPTLEEGHDRLDQMKCAPIHHPASLSTNANFHMGRKNSSHSLISTSSSGAASTSSGSGLRMNPSFESHQSECSEQCDIPVPGVSKETLSKDKETTVFLAPPSYKPGTFPTVLREQTEAEAFSSPSSESSSRSQSTSDVAHVQNPSRKLQRPASIYDNLHEAGFCDLSQDFLNIFDLLSPLGADVDSELFDENVDLLDPRVPPVDVAFWSVDDIVEHTQCLQQMVQTWQSDEEENFEEADGAEESIKCPNFLPSEVIPSICSENTSTTEAEALTSNHVKQVNQLQTKWETLKRSMPACKNTKIDDLQIHKLSAGQLMMLRRLAVVKLTASMEKFSNKTSSSWSVPRFIRRLKVPDYKDKGLFGVPLLNNVQQFGQSLPPCIHHALDYLRKNALGQIGLFRKPGVRARIQNLRAKCEENPHFTDFDIFTPFDVADLVKQYFRELPDPLMTMKLSETFIEIFLNVCQDLRLTVLQAAIILLPDEHREALKALLHFLLDVASNAGENQMSASNLATCLAPSLFHLQITITKLTTSSSSPKLRKSASAKHSSASMMKPNMKEMNDNKAATQCLTFMIDNIEEIFKVPEDSTTQCRMSIMHQPEDVLAAEIGCKPEGDESEDYYKDYHAYVDRLVAQTIREEQKISQNKTGSWQNFSGPSGAETMYKKISDGNPLRLWRSKVEINAKPDEILDRILKERELWDDKLIKSQVLQQIDEKTQVHQSVVSEMSPHPSRDYCVLRTWRKNVNSRDATVIVETSTGDHPVVGDVRGIVLTSRYVIEPTDVPNTCALSRICRIETKGRNPEWYNKTYGHTVARDLLKIRDSFLSTVVKANPGS